MTSHMLHIAYNMLLSVWCCRYRFWWYRKFVDSEMYWQKVKNEGVVKNKKETPNLWKTITKIRDRLVRYILWQAGMVHTIPTEGRVDGKTSRGKQRLAYIKQIALDMAWQSTERWIAYQRVDEAGGLLETSLRGLVAKKEE